MGPGRKSRAETEVNRKFRLLRCFVSSLVSSLLTDLIVSVIGGRIERSGVLFVSAFEACSSFNGLLHLGQVANLGGLHEALVVEVSSARC